MIDLELMAALASGSALNIKFTKVNGDPGSIQCILYEIKNRDDDGAYVIVRDLSDDFKSFHTDSVTTWSLLNEN